MISDIIKSKLDSYNISTQENESNALKEIMQEIALASLSEQHFFKIAIFQGGASLRICHQLPRFSEDLDFILKKPDQNFVWAPYLDGVIKTFHEYGIVPGVKDKSSTGRHIKKLFLKDDSIGQFLELKFKHHPKEKLTIKIEIDVNPPMGSHTETTYHDFPTEFNIVSQDLSSNFACKCHALLCREYIKGRDWFDFTWYIARKTTINFELLSNAIHQYGPWKNQSMKTNLNWLTAALITKIKTIDWEKAKNDVWRFLPEKEQRTLDLWGNDFFFSKVEKLKSYIN